MWELAKAADAGKAGAADEMRRLFDKHPELTREAKVLVGAVEGVLMKKIAPKNPGTAEILMAEIRSIRDHLGYQDAPQLERLIIGEIVISWLLIQWLDIQVVQQETFRAAEFWQRRLTQANKRFLRASTTLAKVRKLTEPKASPATLAYLKAMALGQATGR